MDLTALTALAEQISDASARSRGMARYTTWHLLRLQEEAQDLAQAWVELNGQRGFGDDESRRETFGADIADVLVEVLVLAAEYDVDLGAQMERRARAWEELEA